MIPGFFDRLAPYPRPKVYVDVSIPDLAPRVGSIEFVLDTGASHTCIHLADALTKLRIEPQVLANTGDWAGATTFGGIGGEATYYPVQAALAFQHSDGLIQELRSEIWVAKLEAFNLDLPSTLGWDVLQYFDLHLSWATKEVILQ